MALLPILSFPDPRLRTIAQPVEEVTDEIRQLAADMFETMYEAPGIGLAATQVDGLLAVCFQHEMDHLNGKLFVDYLSPLKRQRAREKVEKLVRQRNKDKVAVKR